MHKSATNSTYSVSAVSWRIAAMGFLGGIGGGVVFPILPALGTTMGLSGLVIGVILAANRVSRLGMNPVTGSLIDRFGGRKVIASGLAIEGIGTLGYIAALHFPLPAVWFFVGRLVWGVGSSLLFVGVMAGVLALSSSGERGRLVARVRGALSIGMPGGLVLGGLVTDFISAGAAFWLATAISIVTGVIALTSIPERPARERESRRRAPSPAGAWRALLASRRLWNVWFCAAIVGFATLGVLLVTLVVLVAQRELLVPGLGAEGSAGLCMAVFMLAYAGTSILIGRRLDVMGRRTAFILPSMLAMAAGFALFAFAHSLALLLVALLVIGIGTGSIIVPLLTLIGDFVVGELRGRATAAYQVASDIGSGAGLVVGLFLGQHFGFRNLYLAIVVLLILSLPLALRLAHTERSVRRVG
jgi:MFS family permease